MDDQEYVVSVIRDGSCVAKESSTLADIGEVVARMAAIEAFDRIEIETNYDEDELPEDIDEEIEE